MQHGKVQYKCHPCDSLKWYVAPYIFLADLLICAGIFLSGIRVVWMSVPIIVSTLVFYILDRTEKETCLIIDEWHIKIYRKDKVFGERIIFQTLRKNIVAIYIKRANVFDFLFFGCAPVFLKACTTMSFFCDVNEIEVFDRKYNPPNLKPEECRDNYEYPIALSIHKCKKVCKVLGIKPKMISQNRKQI